MYFFLRVGSVGVGREKVNAFIVIETEDVSGATARGFLPIDPAATEEEIREHYGVTEIFRILEPTVN